MGVVLRLSRAVIACAVAGALMGGPAARAAAEDEESILRRWGAETLANAPAKIRNGSQLERAKYAMTKYCEVLQKHNVGVNSNLWTRLQQWSRNSDASRWTCSDHANKLGAIMDGMGIKRRALVKADSNSSLPTPNADHGAVMVIDGGKAAFFDPWQFALANGRKYDGAAYSKWNGMTPADWEREMRAQGYIRFDGGDEKYHAALAAAIAQHLGGSSGKARLAGAWKLYIGDRIGTPSEESVLHTGTLNILKEGSRVRVRLSVAGAPPEWMADPKVTDTTLVFTRNLPGLVQRFRGYLTPAGTLRGTFSHMGPGGHAEQRWRATR